MATTVLLTKTLAAASADNISLSQSPGSGAILLNGAAVTNGVATIDTYNSVNNTEPGVRVIIASGGNDSGITFTITGTNSNKQIISDIVTGTNVGTAQSNLDFVTVTGITASAAVAGTVIIGTNGVGSTRWITWNYNVTPPMNLGMAVDLVSGAANYTVQYTYDDPNNLSAGLLFPTAFNSILLNQAAGADATISTPIVATRLLVNSGTGTLRARFVQAGIG